MSIYIKELNVTLQLGEYGGDEAADKVENHGSKISSDTNACTLNHAAVVQDAVKEVIRILKEKNER
ncbi:MAG: hypothetical protein IT222_11340 [Crocinitomix sp.]|nr:hypothetical protein [Crocinitomix sp.]